VVLAVIGARAAVGLVMLRLVDCVGGNVEVLLLLEMFAGARLALGLTAGAPFVCAGPAGGVLVLEVATELVAEFRVREADLMGD
jgi:hypothetical protein